MGPVSAELGIDVPREDAFDFVSDLANRPAFSDHFIDQFRLFALQSTGVGAGARFRLFAPPRALWMDTTLVELDRPHRISERGSGGRLNRIPAATEWELLAGPGGLTTVRVTFWTETGNPIDRAKDALGGASIWHRRNWATALRRLRDLLEAGRDDGARPAGAHAGVAGGAAFSTTTHQ